MSFELYRFSLAALDEMQLKRIRAVKERLREYRENLDRAARNQGSEIKRAHIPDICQVLARGYYSILEDAGWDQEKEEVT